MTSGKRATCAVFQDSERLQTVWSQGDSLRRLSGVAREGEGSRCGLIATPDFWHAEHTIACLKKDCTSIARRKCPTASRSQRHGVAGRKAGKLLQIGHQRRSNPRYIYRKDKVLNEANLLNRITNFRPVAPRRAACVDLGWPKGTDIPAATLKNMVSMTCHSLQLALVQGLGSPIVDLVASDRCLQLVFGNALPSSVMASGGVDYWKDHEWYDNAIAIFEFPTEKGLVRASYETLTTNSSNGYYELFMGDEGTFRVCWSR